MALRERPIPEVGERVKMLRLQPALPTFVTYANVNPLALKIRLAQKVDLHEPLGNKRDAQNQGRKCRCRSHWIWSGSGARSRVAMVLFFLA